MRNKSDGAWVCPVYHGIENELELLGIGATIDDLDALVERVRRQGAPKQKAGDPIVIHAPSQLPPSISPSASSSLSPINRTSSQSSAPSSYSTPQESIQETQYSLSSLSLHNGSTPIHHQPNNTFESVYSNRVIQPPTAQNNVASNASNPAFRPMPPVDFDNADYEEEPVAGLLVKMTSSTLNNVALELNLHTGLVRTLTSMTFASQLKSPWLTNPIEVVAKLAPLHPEGPERDHQLIAFNEAYRLYRNVHLASHPNILSVIGKEDIINCDGSEYCLAVLEKADMNLFDFFYSYMHSQPAWEHHKRYVTQVTNGLEVKSPCLTKLWRQFYDQILSAYSTLYEIPRARQRPIHPKNILVSFSSTGLTPSPALNYSQASIKVSDFPMIGLMTQNDMPAFSSQDPALFGLPYGTNVPKDAAIASDLFSIGCVLYFIASGGESLFEDVTQIRDCQTNSKLQGHLKRHNVHKSDPLALDLIFRLTLPKPEERGPIAVLRHHPATWSPAQLVKNLFRLHEELISHKKTSGIDTLRATLSSPTFFSYAFMKRTSWQPFVLHSWLTAWPQERGPIVFDSITCLLELIHRIASSMNNSIMLENFGIALSRHLAYFLAALWSHVPSFGSFDEQHNIILAK